MEAWNLNMYDSGIQEHRFPLLQSEKRTQTVRKLVTSQYEQTAAKKKFTLD